MIYFCIFLWGMKIFGVFNDLLPPRYLSNLMTAPIVPGTQMPRGVGVSHPESLVQSEAQACLETPVSYMAFPKRLELSDCVGVVILRVS